MSRPRGSSRSRLVASAMMPEQRSRALRQEADDVLGLIDLSRLSVSIGPLMPTGSYFMDLMMYPDIDVNLPLTTPENLMGIAVELSKLECVKRLRFLRGKEGPLKDGLYLKPDIEYGNWWRLWKIDIWSLPAAVLETAQTEMADLKRRMTAAHRAIILDTKFRLLTDEGRTPMYSGIFIYRAVINLGMIQPSEIDAYLIENDIVLQLD